jgi:hypothetical protein
VRSKGGHFETKNISRAKKIVVTASLGKNLCDINSNGFQKNQKHGIIALVAKKGVQIALGCSWPAATEQLG